MNRAPQATHSLPATLKVPKGHLQRYLKTVSDRYTEEIARILNDHAQTEQPDFSVYLRWLVETHDKHNAQLHGVSLFLGGIQNFTAYQTIRNLQDAFLDQYNTASAALLQQSNADQAKETLPEHPHG